METKIFVGYLIDHLLREEIREKKHTLTLTIKRGQEYIGLRSKESAPTLATLEQLKEQVIHQLQPLCEGLLLEENQLQLFPECLLG